MKQRTAFTLMEILLVVLLSTILAGGLAGLLIWETRVYSMTSERNANTARLMDAYLLMLKILRPLNPIELVPSGQSGVSSATTILAFDDSGKRLLWQGFPILDRIEGEFSYNGHPRADNTGANWAVNWATAVIRIEMMTTGDHPEPLSILVHPRKS